MRDQFKVDMKNLISIILFFTISVSLLNAQSKDSLNNPSTDFFEQKIGKYVGLPAPLFEAPDLDGTKHYLDAYEDYIVVLHFWQVFSDPSTSQIPSLNKIVEEYFDRGVVVFGFATNDVEDLTNFKKEQKVNYPLIPNSMQFSKDYYGGEMGYPRVFLIDKYGIVQKVLVGGKPGDFMDLYNDLVPFIEEHLKY